jgi:protein MpaA
VSPPRCGTVDAVHRVATLTLVAALGVLGCGAETTTTGEVTATVDAPRDAVPTSTGEQGATPDTSTSTTTDTTTSTSTTSTSTTSTTTTSTIAIPATTGPLDLDADRVGLGRSVDGRPIIAERSGTVGGRRVLVIGVIHGNEDAGVAIVEDLRSTPVPDGVELWIVESMNPDGQAGQFRGNANGVDLNRNFPYRWGPIGELGDSQYAGPAPASEPETQAMVNFMSQLRPDITIWYHQDLFVINPSDGREGRVRTRYAQLTGLPMGQITGGTYTGVAATWARNEFRDADGVAFIVELGPTLSPQEAVTHADAVRTIAVEG